MSDDTPTVRFEQAEPNGGGEDGGKKSKALLIALSIVGGILLLAVVVLLTLLFSRGMGTPAAAPGSGPSGSATPSATASETPSASPSDTPSAAPSESPSSSPSAPPSNKTAIDQFTVSPTTVTCNNSAPGGPFPLYIKFTWRTTNVTQIGFGVATDDGINQGMGWNLPTNGNSDDNFPPGNSPYEFPCPSASQTYTLTVIGPDGKVSKKVTVTNNGDH